MNTIKHLLISDFSSFLLIAFFALFKHPTQYYTTPNSTEQNEEKCYGLSIGKNRSQQQLRGRQYVQQLLDTLKLEERFAVFDVVFSKAMMEQPWVITRWDMEIYRIARQLKIHGVAKASIEHLVYCSDDHRTIDRNFYSIYDWLSNTRNPEDICFLVSYSVDDRLIEFFNEEMDFSSTERGDLRENKMIYLYQKRTPWELIKSLFEEEGINQSTYFTSTRSNIGGDIILCGFIIMNLEKFYLICEGSY